METRGLKNTAFLAIISAVFAVALVGVSTYAWFTNNNAVETGVVSGKSGESNAALLIGQDPSNLVDSNETDVEILQINEADMRDLHAVSTSDLNKFWYCANMRNGIASTFQEDSGENNIYHGRVFVEMAGDQLTSEDKFKLYIDTSDATGGSIVGDDTGHLLSAARVGLKVEDAEPIIIHFEDGDAKSDINTKVDGQLVEAGQVIGPNGQTVTDPSEELDEYQLDSSEDPIEVPNKSVATLTANEPAQIDVYFYLEGCDPNCIEDIETNEAKLHLAFYAIAE